MRIVLQRVLQAQVSVDNTVVGQIGRGMLVFLGVGHDDDSSDVEYLVDKIIHLRIFDDADGKMNLDALVSGGEFLIVSQFTLLGDCRKGRRPSFNDAASPQKAEELYLAFIDQLKTRQVVVRCGQFRASMNVSLINDGPVTFILDSDRQAIERNNGQSL